MSALLTRILIYGRREIIVFSSPLLNKRFGMEIKMLKKEILSVLKSKRVLIIALIIFLIPIMDINMAAKQLQVSYKRAHKEEILEADRESEIECEKEGGRFISGWLAHPAYASFLSRSTQGHTTQIMILWLLPFFVLNLVSDRYIWESKKGYTNIMLSRGSRKKYMLSKYAASFLIPFVVFALSLLLNFVLAQIIFRDGNNFMGLEVLFDDKYEKWFRIEGRYPNLMYLLYVFVTAFLVGMCGLITQSLAFISKRYTITYIVGFFIWMWLQTTPYNLTYATQPFIEYGFEDFIKSVALYVGTGLLISTVTVIFKVRQDEL